MFRSISRVSQNRRETVASSSSGIDSVQNAPVRNSPANRLLLRSTSVRAPIVRGRLGQIARAQSQIESSLSEQGQIETDLFDTVPSDRYPSVLGPIESGPSYRGPSALGSIESGPSDGSPSVPGPVESGPSDKSPSVSGPIESGPSDKSSSVPGPIESGPSDGSPCSVDQIENGPYDGSPSMPSPIERGPYERLFSRHSSAPSGASRGTVRDSRARRPTLLRFSTTAFPRRKLSERCVTS